MLSERRLRWLGHVRRMDKGRIPKDLLYGQLEQGSRPTGRPHLRYRDACKRDLRSAQINIESWEDTASNRSSWRHVVKAGVRRAEAERTRLREQKRQKRKASIKRDDSIFTCDDCNRDCHSRIGLLSHRRRCSSTRAQSIVS